jgi:hypothetical protein
MVWKELRETGWIGLAAYFACVANAAGYRIPPFWSAHKNALLIPFLEGDFLLIFCVVSICFAVALGLAQTVAESRRGTWLFLRHRPMNWRRILAAKLAVGGGVYFVCSGLAILGYGLWAATPGTHASPFEWWMTANCWRAWAVIGLLYFGAFLSGIRPARWFGTRLLPLFAAGIAAAFLATIPVWPLLGASAVLSVATGLLVLVDFTARTRDFS